MLYYDIEKCESALKTETLKLFIILTFLVILFIAAIAYSISEIKDNKAKKFPYIQLVAIAVIFAFLFVSLCSQISTYYKDIAEESYEQYEGSATISSQRHVLFGGIPTGHTEYIISFDKDGTQVELSTRNRCDYVGDIDKIFIVYSKYSKHIIKFELIK